MMDKAFSDFRSGWIKSKNNTNIRNCFEKEIKLISLCALGPALVCLVSSLFGWDCNLLPIGIMVVCVAYSINEKEKDIVNEQSFNHIAVWIRNSVLLSAWLLSEIVHFLCDETIFGNLWPLNVLILSYFMVLKYLAIYRLYLNLWKAVAVFLRQSKLTELFLNNDSQTSQEQTK